MTLIINKLNTFTFFTLYYFFTLFLKCSVFCWSYVTSLSDPIKMDLTHFFSLACEIVRLFLLLLSIYTFIRKFYPNFIIPFCSNYRVKKILKKYNPYKKRVKLTFKIMFQNFKNLYKYMNLKIFFPILIAILFYDSITLCEPHDSRKIHHFVLGKDGIFREVTIEEEHIKELQRKLEEKERVRDELEFDIITTIFIGLLVCGMVYLYRHYVDDWLFGPENGLSNDLNYNICTQEGLKKYADLLIKFPEYRNEPYYSDYHLKWLGKEDRLRRWTCPVFTNTSVHRKYTWYDPEFVDEANAYLNKYDAEHRYPNGEKYRYLYKDVTSKEDYFAKFPRFGYPEKDWDEMDLWEQFLVCNNRLFEIIERNKPGFDRKAFIAKTLEKWKNMEPATHCVKHADGYHIYKRDPYTGLMMKRTNASLYYYYIDEITGKRLPNPFKPVEYAETNKSYVTGYGDSLLMNEVINGKLLCYTDERGWHVIEKGHPEPRKPKRIPKNTSFIDVNRLYPSRKLKGSYWNERYFEDSGVDDYVRSKKWFFKSPNFNDTTFRGPRRKL